jgi:molybdenum cofactor guanylyltransferase
MKFSAALLAGGRSSRMAQDKAFLDWHGRPLWRVQLEKLISLAPEKIFIAARAEQDFAALLSRKPDNPAITSVNDPDGEDCGPIGAIARCLRLSAGPLLVLAVDMPVMSTDFLRERLLSVATETTGVVFRGRNGYEALAAVYAPAALPFFEAALAAGRFALQPLLAEIAGAGLCAALDVRTDEEAHFSNANTPAEAARLLGFQF